MIFYILLGIAILFATWHCGKAMFAMDWKGIEHCMWGAIGLIAVLALLLGRYL